jgi:hypothetical protein
VKKVTILFREDMDCEMESLYVNDVCIGFGNVWDNHCGDRLDAVKLTLDTLKIEYEYEHDPDWSYEDG